MLRRAWGQLGINVVERWCEYNATFFDGALRPVPLVLTHTQPFGKRLGFCSYNPDRKGRTITLNVPSRKHAGRQYQLLPDNCSLLHEMVHQFLFEHGEDAAHLSKGWRREIMRLTKQINGAEIWAGPSVVHRIDGKPTRINAPNPETGQQSLTQAVIARWPHDDLGINLGALGEVKHDAKRYVTDTDTKSLADHQQTAHHQLMMECEHDGHGV